jgi:hypothetical protein
LCLECHSTAIFQASLSMLGRNYGKEHPIYGLHPYSYDLRRSQSVAVVRWIHPFIMRQVRSCRMNRGHLRCHR